MKNKEVDHGHGWIDGWMFVVLIRFQCAFLTQQQSRSNYLPRLLPCIATQLSGDLNGCLVTLESTCGEYPFTAKAGVMMTMTKTMMTAMINEVRTKRIKSQIPKAKKTLQTQVELTENAVENIFVVGQWQQSL